MNRDLTLDNSDAHRRLERAYNSEKPRLLAGLRAAGRTLEEAEDLVHDVYAETMERLPVLAGIRNLPAWINSLLRRRVIDAWRHERVRETSGETDVAEETLREIIAGVGLDPLDGFVRESMVNALNTALRALPAAQRRVVEAQVFDENTDRLNDLDTKLGDGDHGRSMNLGFKALSAYAREESPASISTLLMEGGLQFNEAEGANSSQRLQQCVSALTSSCNGES